MRGFAIAASITSLLLSSSSVLAQARHHGPAKPTAETPAAPPVGTEPDKPQTKIDLALAVGETKTISASGVANYSEGQPGVADMRLSTDGTQFFIAGIRPGATTLQTLNRDGSQTTVAISVFARAPQQVEAEVNELIDGYTGLRVRRVGSRFFIEGGVSNEGDLKRIDQIAKLYPGQVESLVGVGAGAADRSTNIRIDVFFVQYSKNSSYNVGISWPTTIGGGAISTALSYDFISQTPAFTANISNQPLPGLDIASSHGWAKVMKQATLITTNGVEAKLANGGEQNFSTASGLTSTIRPINFGTNLTIVPRFDPQSRDLEVKVEADVSDLVDAVAGTSIPGRQTANLTTLVHMKLGQSVILSGIHTMSKIHAVSGIPGLSQIPVLGVFFGAHSDTEQETEGAIFIVPSVMDLGDKAALDLIRDATRQYDRYSGNISAIRSFERTPNVNATIPTKR